VKILPKFIKKDAAKFFEFKVKLYVENNGLLLNSFEEK
jgi:hypothetical protein